MRAVLDVNVLVSALLSREGSPSQLLRSWRLGAFELVVSEELVDELERTLKYPKTASRISAPASEAFGQLLRHHATWFSTTGIEPVVRSRDGNDDYLIALAQISRSNLVSGDNDLLVLANRIPVSTPAQFLELLQIR